MAYLLERDALNGKEGKAFLTQEGRIHEMFSLKNLHVNAEFEESDFKVVGTRIIQKKTSGIQLLGDMEIYLGSPLFLDMALKYINGGILPYFTLQVTNNDPGSTVGEQTIALENAKLKNCPLTVLDAEAEYLAVKIDFSFTYVRLLKAFSNPKILGV